MELSVAERLVLLSLLPQRTNFSTWKIVDGVIGKVGLSEEELKRAIIKPSEQDPTQVNVEDNFSAEIEISDWFLEHCKKELKRLDGSDQLLREHRSLYERFVEQQ